MSAGAVFVGLILAAGRSRRMHRLKQTLPWPGGDGPAFSLCSTVVASAFDAISSACGSMIVVVGDDAGEVTDALSGRAFTSVKADSDAAMSDSLLAGLRALQRTQQPFDGVLVQPGDHPGVQGTTLQRLVNEFESSPTKAIMPEHLGKGGHPVLIPRKLLDRIMVWIEQGSGGGLRQFWLDHPADRMRVPVIDAMCIAGMNTQAEYHEVMRRFLGLQTGFLQE